MYVPDETILNRYADVLINFALNSGEGIKPGETVYLQVPENAKPLLIALRKAVWKSKGHMIVDYLPDNVARDFYEVADDSQLDFFPGKYLKGIVDEMDHAVMIIADTDKKELEGIKPERIMRKSKAFKPYKDWRRDKENRGEFTWTLALYGTEASAKEAGLSLEEYWNEIIKACFLDEDDPVGKWKSVYDEVERIRHALTNLAIEKLKVRGQGIDLIVGLGENRCWLGGSGRNIPSFEVFISPDARITEGKVRFNQPLYRYGNIVKGIRLEFKDGKVVKAEADSGLEVLEEMIKVEGANKIGEFSLTDARLSRITKFMAETLFDENIGGEFGNMHIALGEAYKDSYPGDASKVSKEQWNEMGYNESVVHTDMVSTEDKEVIAVLKDGSEKVIYKSGKFLI
ncbi:aminopeptidase [Candidatus Pacearchaeota archaeon CG10_big_fil_rev_8_21_14_0_10_35_219]|nr:aminopeptidase [Candidatus Pacearchaeota archaeon]OIO42679.1 MAG: thermophilic metalloprotease (M29) superfamily [Candidatus Pacearchaeota archaeon CG1_02_35_32]PIO08297.1 MAG: aminopeptidase [Candidatus Pacearchaeota archaeon CG10_big_fil_rev_8_21_14_0_10_35_219]PIY81898.1 MAG: aminopeptidase [Candidatus Pacearchaeota archaeon CG_4_10_14_0_8_um_filter_35_169]PIZ79361.1 MAG: aminopeptidase [Candidatus Pacearchaeota archaeon CG_4_10_14_0_2_um_filter_35_33]PJA70041.1 MAG: aminopeptidase [Cand